MGIKLSKAQVNKVIKQIETLDPLKIKELVNKKSVL